MLDLNAPIVINIEDILEKYNIKGINTILKEEYDNNQDVQSDKNNTNKEYENNINKLIEQINSTDVNTNKNILNTGINYNKKNILSFKHRLLLLVQILKNKINTSERMRDFSSYADKDLIKLYSLYIDYINYNIHQKYSSGNIKQLILEVSSILSNIDCYCKTFNVFNDNIDDLNKCLPDAININV
jgi:hypothetical protein